MKKPKVLIILQNAWTNSTCENLKKVTYTTSWINRKNATYSRIVPTLEPHFEIHFTECTSKLAKDSKTKFETDLEWVKAAVMSDDWASVIAFGSQAHSAIDDLGYEAKKLPHPVSFLWRKHLIQDLTQELLNEILEKNKV